MAWKLCRYVLSCQNLTFLSLPPSCDVTGVVSVMVGACQNTQRLLLQAAKAREFNDTSTVVLLHSENIVLDSTT